MITGPSFCTKLQTVNTTKGASKEQKCKSTELLNWVRACLPTKNHKHINKALRKRGKKKKDHFNYSTCSQHKPHGLCEISFVLLVRSRKLCSRSNTFREAVLLIATPS